MKSFDLGQNSPFSDLEKFTWVFERTVNYRLCQVLLYYPVYIRPLVLDLLKKISSINIKSNVKQLLN